MNAKLNDHVILRALFAAARPVEATPGGDPFWTTYSFDAEALKQALRSEFKAANVEVDSAKLSDFATDFSERIKLRKSRCDDLILPCAGNPHLSRKILLDGLGALAARLFPTRRSSRVWAVESARELAYFGRGSSDQLVLSSPFDAIRGLADGASSNTRPLLVEEGPRGRREMSECELRAADAYFHRHASTPEELKRFQEDLRQDPLDSAVISTLRDFFEHRLIVSVRGAARWCLGSRHPWFGWSHARQLIEESFSEAGEDSFFVPRFHAYMYDESLESNALEQMVASNRAVAAALAERLRKVLPENLEIPQGSLAELIDVLLDYHFDLPDYDGETLGQRGATSTARFVLHAMQGLQGRLAGHPSNLRPNWNFEGQELDFPWFNALPRETQIEFFQSLRQVLRQGVAVDYKRPKMACYMFYESSSPKPRAGETLVDSFRLSDIKAPEHAIHLQRLPAFASKLCVFFTLVLRHCLDTGHFPDLQPPYALRDFLLLGTWGYDSWNVRVNLYRSDDNSVRIEIRHIGRLPQIAGHRVFAPQAALAKHVSVQLGPLFQPSIQRALSIFLMAKEEIARGNRRQAMGHIAWMRRGIDLSREVMQQGVRGALLNATQACENMIGRGTDALEAILDLFDDPRTHE